jgi:glyoxylase-like metal-dependent hydrolase (beta-lactamase superfamily II)
VARLRLRHPQNAPGQWFVDEECIDCGTCREVAPQLFGSIGVQSVVLRQPSPDGADDADPPTGLAVRDLSGAWLAAQACPTQSIGTIDHVPRPGRMYPREIRPRSGVFDCGYCSPDSFGATSWFITRPEGNVLVDSPRFNVALARAFEEMGGIAHLVLTHRDDVADGHRWADHFDSRVWIHADDAGAAPFATDHLHGLEEVTVAGGLVAVPVPGHTRGSTVFLLDGHDLFTGDSLAWSHERGDLTAFRHACWYSWSVQADSLARLADRHRFASVLPGHGARTEGDPDELHDRLVALVDRMR